jgi:hypothetical protein
MALGSTQPLNEYFLGGKGWQPYYLHVPIVLKSGSLNFLETSGPVQACLGIALPFIKDYTTVTDVWAQVNYKAAWGDSFSSHFFLGLGELEIISTSFSPYYCH